MFDLLFVPRFLLLISSVLACCSLVLVITLSYWRRKDV